MSAAGERWEGLVKKPVGQRGRTHRSVLLVPCPQCRARRGRLCRGENGPKLETHYVRRHAVRPQARCLCVSCTEEKQNEKCFCKIEER